LNIFFGENSVYTCDEPMIAELCNRGEFDADPTGRDMMFNPTDQAFVQNTPLSIMNFYGGGQHHIYVTNTEYDGCNEIYTQLKPASDQTQSDFARNFQRVNALKDLMWTSFPIANRGGNFLPYSEGLVPSDVTVKVRVDNPYNVKVGTGVNNGNPTYQLSFEGVAPSDLTTETDIDSALAMINVVPNPYYGFSDYETSQFSNVIKVTNLPAKATITIYTLDGKFVRQYERDEVGLVPEGTNRALMRSQVNPDLEWDLKNSKGIPVASGVYLIHVDAPGLGERVLKWFGVARQFDPSGL